jgi:hypothetical protein
MVYRMDHPLFCVEKDHWSAEKGKEGAVDTGSGMRRADFGHRLLQLKNLRFCAALQWKIRLVLK